MPTFDEYLEDLKAQERDFVRTNLVGLNNVYQAGMLWAEAVCEAITEQKKSGKLSLAAVESLKYKDFLGQTSTKENIDPLPRRSPDTTDGASSSQRNVRVKLEKRSEAPPIPKDSEEKLDEAAANIKIKQEQMPAPLKEAPKRKRKKKSSNSMPVAVKKEPVSKRTKRQRKGANAVDEQENDSDVVLQNETITTVEISDSESNCSATNGNTTLLQVQPSTAENLDVIKAYPAPEPELASSKLPKGLSRKEVAKAIAEKKVNKDATYIASDLMTDDESEPEQEQKPVAKAVTKSPVKTVKPLFNPFEESPVRKKVEAFEKLGADTGSAIPMRMTRTKTRKQAEERTMNETVVLSQADKPATVAAIPSTLPPEEEAPKLAPSSKQNFKVFTPTISKFLPKTCSTSKIQRQPIQSNSSMMLINDSMTIKSASALKASQAEYRERERQRREKEAEALRKKEALMQAQTEEKKRKREEKQLKAQQHREAMEKEVLKRIEEQRLKEEKHKMLLAEREEKLLKQKEELERKRLLAKQKAQEEKRKEEARRAEEMKKAEKLQAQLAKQDEKLALMAQQKREREQQQQQQKPIYMLHKAPLLPTDDCYDSDDPENGKKTAICPAWTRESELKRAQQIQIAAGEKVKNTLFCCQAQTPDLQKIFELIDPRILKRTSSGVWKKPPRYTLMPGLATHEESHLEDEDED